MSVPINELPLAKIMELSHFEDIYKGFHFI